MACLAVLVLAHIAILYCVAISWKYYDIYPSIFGSVVAIILCLLAIIDIIFFVGFNHMDLALKIISSALAFLLLITGSIGTYYLNRTNKIVNNLFDDGSDKYETFSGVFVCYDKYNNFSKIEDLSGKRVGLLLETSDGITYLANNILSNAKIDFATVDFNTNTELMAALIDGKVDAIAITSAYRTIYGAKDDDGGVNVVQEVTEETENGESEEGSEDSQTFVDQGETSPFAVYMDHLIEFNPFEEELKIETGKRAKNLANEPFNVLLIGYSRTEIGSPVGLADSIILATINPQSYTVSMTSIARDSFVPIACYNNARDKINSGRSTSRACFVETVENFVGVDIDYYMELDYLGLVQIVNTIGGVMINNPVDFTLDGIYVPAGTYLADGQQALQFSRERHHMPGGDFARQQHQKEVIIEIARKLVTSGDLTLALNAMDAASEWMSTDMTLSQLTNIFNLLLNTKNFTSLDTFNLVDFQNTRITGNGGVLYYSYDMRLPLWVYLVYQGSYDDSMEHVKNVMGNWDSVSQEKNFTFSLDDKYVRPDLVSNDYDNKYMFEPDPMPAYWATLIGLSESQAASWARANGVGLNIEYIYKGESGFDGNLSGYVVDQNRRYGSLVSEYPSGTITVMGPDEIDESKMVPDFVGHSYANAVEWAKSLGIPYSVDFDVNAEGTVGKVVAQSPKPYTSIDEVDKLKVIVKAGTYEIKFNKNGHGSDTPNSITMVTGDEDFYLDGMRNSDEADGTWEFAGWYTNPDHSQGERITDTSQVSSDITLYARWINTSHEHTGEWKVTEPTCGKDGSMVRVCTSCGEKEKEIIPATGDHKWSDWTQVSAPEIGKNGQEKRVCSVCKEEETRDIPALEPELVTCWDGSEAESADKCPASVTCWDGSLAYDEASCPAESQPEPDPEPQPETQPEPEPEPQPEPQPEPEPEPQPETQPEEGGGE